MTKRLSLMVAATLGLVVPLGAMMVGDDDKDQKTKVQAAIGKPAPDFTLKDSQGSPTL